MPAEAPSAQENARNLPVTDINDAGAIVGWQRVPVEGSGRAFLWSRGRLTYLGGPGSVATAINNRGEVAGVSLTPGGGRMRAIRLPTGAIGGQATGINNRGVITLIVSWQRDRSWEAGYLVYRGGRLVRLGVPPGQHTEVRPYAINDRNQVVGHAEGGAVFVWQRGRFTILRGLDGFSAFPADINDRGQIVGSGYLDEMPTAGAEHRVCERAACAGHHRGDGGCGHVRRLDHPGEHDLVRRRGGRCSERCGARKDEQGPG